MGILEFILGPLLLNFYNISPEVLSTARKGIFALSFILPLELLGVVIMVGILRSGGDSKFSMLSEIIPMYLISIPLTFIGASIYLQTSPLGADAGQAVRDRYQSIGWSIENQKRKMDNKPERQEKLDIKGDRL